MRRERPGFDPSRYDELRKKETPAEVKARIGPDVVARYLAISDGDSAEAQEIKEKIADLDLDQTIEALVDRKKAQDVLEAMKTLGISREVRKSGKSGKTTERWLLKNPDPESRTAGSFADTEHLKAFIAGFAEAGNDAERVKVLQNLCQYLDIPAPTVEEIMGAMEEEAEVPTVPGRPPEQAPKGPNAEIPPRTPGERKKPPSAIRQASTSGWKSLLLSAGVVLVMLRGDASPHKAQAELPRSSEVVRDPGAESSTQAKAEKAESAKADSYVLRKGDNPEKIVRSLLGDRADDKKLVKELTEVLLLTNDIASKSYGTSGDRDTLRLGIGSSVDLGPVKARLDMRLAELKKIDDLRESL